jgi:hypothetical protein
MCLMNPGDQAGGCRVLENLGLRSGFNSIFDVQLAGDALYVAEWYYPDGSLIGEGRISKLTLATLAISEVTTLGDGEPHTLAIDGSTIYFSDLDSATGTYALRSVPLSGGDSALLADGFGEIRQLQVVNGLLYFLHEPVGGFGHSVLSSLPVAGGNATDSAFYSVGAYAIAGNQLFVSGERVASELGIYAGSLPFPGDASSARQLDPSTAQWLGLDGSNVYFFAYNAYKRVPQAGPPSVTVQATPFSLLSQVFSAGSDVLASDGSTLYSLPIVGGTLKPLGNVPGNIVTALADATHVYVADSARIWQLAR